MLVGYMRISKADGSQVLDLQKDALLEAGVDPQNIYEDRASGMKDDRPGFNHCLRAMKKVTRSLYGSWIAWRAICGIWSIRSMT